MRILCRFIEICFILLPLKLLTAVRLFIRIRFVSLKHWNPDCACCGGKVGKYLRTVSIDQFYLHKSINCFFFSLWNVTRLDKQSFPNIKNSSVLCSSFPETSIFLLINSLSNYYLASFAHLSVLLIHSILVRLSRRLAGSVVSYLIRPRAAPTRYICRTLIKLNYIIG